MPKIYVEIIGQGQPLVLIHGWGWHSGIWHPLVADLQQHFQLFLVDLPGFGKSPVLTTDYSFENIAALLEPILPLKATWLGWSLGGTFAWWLAIHRPERVLQLITVASSPRFIADSNWPGMAPATLEKFTQLLRDNYQKTLIDFLELQLRGSTQQKELLAELQQQLLTTPKTAMPALLSGLKLLQETDLRTDLKKTTCPSLHIFGQNDVLVPTAIIPSIQSALPEAHCEIIKRAGHIPFLTQPQDFLTIFSFYIKSNLNNFL